MKHIKQIAKILAIFSFQFVMMILGLVVVAIALFRTEPFKCNNPQIKDARRFKNKWIDAIWGNEDDGIDGDTYYSAKYSKLTYWTSYNWSALRNPVNNLGMRLGVNDNIVEYKVYGKKHVSDKIGQEGFQYTEAITDSGKVYPLYYYTKRLFGNYGIKFDAGYKNFNITKVPKHYKYGFVLNFNPFKHFSK